MGGLNDMAKLDINIGALSLKNPVLTASGTFGYGEEFADFIDLNRLGGFIVKGTTLNPREGNPYPRMAETPSGMLNAVGLQNKGVDYFIENIYPRIKDLDTNIMVNVSGACPDDYVAVCEKLAPLSGIAAVEINISCPNVKQGGMAFMLRRRRSDPRCTPGISWHSDCKTIAQRNRYNRDSSRRRGRRCRCCIADKYTPRNGYRRRAHAPLPVYSYRRAIGAGRKARRSQDGMAGGKSRQHSGNRSWRHYERQGCSRIHYGWSNSRRNRHR